MGGMVGGWIREIGYAFRGLRRAPGYAAVIILTLGLGIGVNSAIFSAIHGILLAPLPYEHGERLVRVRAGPTDAAGIPQAPSPLEQIDLRERSNTLSDLLEYHTMFFNLLEEGVEPERVQVGVVSWDFFQVLGVPPLHGRSFVSSEDAIGAEPVLLLGYDYWVRRYGGDPDVVGRMVEMNNRPHRIVGVLPQVPTYPNQNDVWMPWYACPFRIGDGWHLDRAARGMLTVGRIRPGAQVQEVEAEMERLAHELHAEFPDAYAPDAVVGAEVLPLKEVLTGDARPTFWVLMAMSTLVLLIACANVANLTLTRVNQRRHEVAVRSALGAGRMRITRQFVTESVVLALAGAGVAVAVAYGTVGALSSFAADLTPRFAEVRVDRWVLGFTTAVAVVTGVVLGAAPMVLDRKIGSTLRDGRGSSSGGARVRNTLVAVQVGVTVVLLVGAGLTVRSFAALASVDPGFEAEGVLTVTVDLDWARYTEAESRRDFFDQLLSRVGEQPGVEAVSVAADFPMSGTTFQSRAGLDVEGRPRDPGVEAPVVGLRTVSEGYFETLGIELLAGRTFERGDDAESAPVAVVSRALAERHLEGRDPVGRRISTDGGETWMTVVGLVDDVLQSGPDGEVGADLYRSFKQGGGVRRILARTRGEPLELARPITEAVLAQDPRQPVSFVQTLADAQAERVASPRTIMALLAVFGLVALATAAAGLFSVVAWSVQQQRKETGIRLALGEERRSLLARIFRRSLGLVGVGLVAGLAVAALAVRAIEGFLFGVTPLDPTTWIGVCLLLAAVATAAVAGPALRGTRVSPMRVLRIE